MILYRTIENNKPENIDLEKRTADFIFSSGYKGLRRTWNGDFYEELSMDPNHIDLSRFNNAPFLKDHKNSSEFVIGRIEHHAINEGLGKCKVRFGKDEESQRYFEKYQDILDSVSIGYRVSEYTDVSKEGDEIPTLRATRWAPLELSAVAVPFDPYAKIIRQEEFNSINIISTRSFKLGSENIRDTPTITQQPKQEQMRTEDITQIYDVVLKAGLDGSLAKRMISEKMTITQATGIVEDLKASVKKEMERGLVGPLGVEITRDERDTLKESIVSALLHRSDPTQPLVKRAKEFVDAPLYDMAKEWLSPSKRYGSRLDIATRALSSQGDFGVVMGDWANATLQKSYQKVGIKTYTPFCSPEQLNDLRVVNQLKFDETSDHDLSLVKENQNYEYSSFGQSDALQYRLYKYGRCFKLSFEIILNDQFNVIQRFFSKLGDITARTEEKLVYEELTGKTQSKMEDGLTLFDPSHNNVSKKPSIICDESIEEMIEAMRMHKVGKEFVITRPKFLIYGAKQDRFLNRYLNVTGYYPQREEDVKLYQRMFTTILSYELGDTADFYCISDPALFETIKVLSLAGQSAPQVFREEGFDSDCTKIKIRHFFGTRAVDWRGIYKNLGALPNKTK